MAKAPGSRTWDLVVIGLLVLSVALVFWHASADDPGVRRTLEWIDLGLVAFFLVEWGARALRSERRGRWVARNSWELLGMVPIVAPLPAALRVLRLARIVRILRVFGTVGKKLGTWERIASEGNLHKVALASGLVTVIGAVLVWLIERGEPGTHIPDFETAIWWAIVTVTTVGYGDVTPITWQGRVVAAMLMVTGIGTIGLLASSLASVLIVKKEEAHGLGTAGAMAPPVMAGGLTQDLHTLAALHESGKLTDDEYTSAKGKLLR